MQGGADQTINSRSSRAPSNTHWCQVATGVKGALLKSKHALNISVLYSDSTIALWWIKADPSRWNTFVFNRVSQIQSMLPTTEFLHVPSEENPADLSSRGLLATQLVGQQKFWLQNPRGWDHFFLTNLRRSSQRKKHAKKSNPRQC